MGTHAIELFYMLPSPQMHYTMSIYMCKVLCHVCVCWRQRKLYPLEHSLVTICASHGQNHCSHTTAPSFHATAWTWQLRQSFFPLSDAKTDEFRHCGCALRHSCCVARDNDNDKSRYLLKCLQACDRVLSLHQSVQSLCCNIMIDIYFKSEYSPQNVFRRFRTHTALGPPDAWEGWAGSDWTPANGDWDRG